MNSFKPSSGRLRSAFLSLAIVLAFACGPTSSDLNEFMSFFMPESSNARREDQAYHFTPLLYQYDEDAYGADTLVIDGNVRAWVDYLKGAVGEKEVATALYKRGGDGAFVDRLASTNPPALAYLKLAWKVEDAAGNPGTPWLNDARPADTTALAEGLDEVEKAYPAATDAFLKERYAFQAVKLAAQLKDYRKSRRLYEQLVLPLPRKTFISDWAFSRHAGAAFALGDTARAVYEFAQVFDRCPSRRREAELSLRIYGLRFREDALRFCRNDHEKAAVYAVCAVQPKQDALPYLKEIVRLDPRNPLIELIMAREINRNEYYFFQKEVPVYAYDEASRADSLRFVARREETPDYFEQLKTFALESAENRRLGNPAYWYTAAAYLDYCAKDYEEAGDNLEKAGRLPVANPALKQHIALQQALLLTARTKTMTPETEKELIGYLESFSGATNFRLNNAFVEVCKQLAAKYGYGKAVEPPATGWLSGCRRPKTESGSDEESAKGFLLTALTSSQLHPKELYFDNQTDLYDIEDTTSAATVAKVVAYAGKTDPSDFDRRLLKLSGFDSDRLHVLLGRRRLAENRYAEAAAAFARVNETVWKAEPYRTYFKTDPFAVNPTGNQRALTTPNPYTPLQFVRRLVALQQQAARATGDEAAELYYRLGCGAYNLSWHGNAWILVKARWSGGEPVYSSYIYQMLRQTNPPPAPDRIGQDPYYTTGLAKDFFEQARKAARNPELAAKACFMAARCEQNAFAVRAKLEEARQGYNADPEVLGRQLKKLEKAEYSTGLSLFSRQYADTRYHREVLKECATYADFVAGK